MPSYVKRTWHTVLTERLTDSTKLVGATISCSVLVIDTAQPPLQTPHVQVRTDPANSVSRCCSGYDYDDVRFGCSRIGSSDPGYLALLQHQVMATDSVGLEQLKSAGALDCHGNWMDNIRQGQSSPLARCQQQSLLSQRLNALLAAGLRSLERRLRS